MEQPLLAENFQGLHQEGSCLFGGGECVGLGRTGFGQQVIVGRVANEEIREGMEEGAQVLDRVIHELHLAQSDQQALDALLKKLGEQPGLVPEIVVDGGRGVAAALYQLADGEALLSLLKEQGFRGVENDAPRIGAVLLASASGRG